MHKLATTDENRFVKLGQTLFAEAQELEVETHEDVVHANDLLKRTTAAEKEIEEARTDMVKPLNDQVKQINALAKEISAPVEEAKLTVKEKILAFNRKQEEIRLAKERAVSAGISACDQVKSRDEFGILDSLPDAVKQDPRFLIAFDRTKFRIEEEERLAAEKIRQEEERKKIEETKAQQGAEMAKLAEEQAAIDAEKQKIAAERAKLESEKRAAELERQAKEAEKNAPAPVKGIRRSLKMTVKEADLVPRAYCSPDESKIREAVKNGLREIPGVLIEVVESVQ